MRNLLFILLISFFALAACGNNASKRIVVARLGEEVLYRDEIPDLLFHTEISSADSAAIYGAYVNDWIRRELIYQTADASLDYQLRANIENQIRDTRRNLVIYRYEQQMMAAQMDTIVTESSLEEYYTQYLQNFELDVDIVKAYWVKLSIYNTAANRIRTLLLSNREEDEVALNQLCYLNAIDYDNFNKEWMAFDVIKSELPTQIGNLESFLQQNRLYEAADADYRYFVRIYDYTLAGKTAPLEYVSDDIKRMILNNRRIDFIQKLENDIYNTALNNNSFTIY